MKALFYKNVLIELIRATGYKDYRALICFPGKKDIPNFMSAQVFKTQKAAFAAAKRAINTILGEK